MTMMRISQLAERSGVPATTLRFYDDAGLLRADRTASGYRLYDDEALHRLALIATAKHFGLPLDEIGELLTVWQNGECAQVKADLRPRLNVRLAEAEQRTAGLAAFTATLRAALEHLDALPDCSGPCDSECGLLAPAAAAPVACSLTGDGIRDRTAQWQDLLAGAIRAEIPDGLRLTLPSSRIVALAALAAAEQECCGFFDFRLHLDGPRVHLEVRAPAGGRDMLAGLFNRGR